MNFYINKMEINTLRNGNKIVLYSLQDETYKKFISEARNVSNANENQAFYDKYGFKVHRIRLHGETDVWNSWGSPSNKEYNINQREVEKTLQTILPRPKTVKNPITNAVYDSYKCYCTKDLNIEDILFHKTATESWRCLIAKLGNPKYAIVVEFKQEEIII